MIDPPTATPPGCGASGGVDLRGAPEPMTITKGGPGGTGERIPILVQTARHGGRFAFDRSAGEPVWPLEEKPVAASDVPGQHAGPTRPAPTTLGACGATPMGAAGAPSA